MILRFFITPVISSLDEIYCIIFWNYQKGKILLAFFFSFFFLASDFFPVFFSLFFDFVCGLGMPNFIHPCSQMMAKESHFLA